MKYGQWQTKHYLHSSPFSSFVFPIFKWLGKISLSFQCWELWSNFQEHYSQTFEKLTPTKSINILPGNSIQYLTMNPKIQMIVNFKLTNSKLWLVRVSKFHIWKKKVIILCKGYMPRRAANIHPIIFNLSFGYLKLSTANTSKWKLIFSKN